ncbi:MAG: hypothetical protein M1118_00785 [Chloroflexi bacterium]|nr:hypothetical protein [Chloroflexota bacterium]
MYSTIGSISDVWRKSRVLCDYYGRLTSMYTVSQADVLPSLDAMYTPNVGGCAVESFTITVVILILIAVIGTPLIRRLTGGGSTVCNRCDGTGEVQENWPDPSELSGWHRVNGTCPKCKGKGRINVR